MSFKFQTAVQVENIADEQNDAAFEVIMPEMDLYKLFPKTSNTTTTENKTDVNASDKTENSDSKPKTKYWSPIVEEISFTPRSFKTTTGRIRSQWLNFVADLENMQNARITMFCSQNMLTEYYLLAWNNLIYNQEGEYFNGVNYYKRDIEVYLHGSAISSLTSVVVNDDHTMATARFTLKGAFPIKQDSFKLKYSKDPKRLTISADFVYDRLVPDEKLAKSAIWSETISTLGLSNLSDWIFGGNGTNKYNISDNY